MPRLPTRSDRLHPSPDLTPPPTFHLYIQRISSCCKHSGQISQHRIFSAFTPSDYKAATPTKGSGWCPFSSDLVIKKRKKEKIPENEMKPRDRINEIFLV